MKFKRIISTALALVMALGVLAVIPHEAEAATVTPLSAGKVDEKGKPLINYTGKGSSDVFETREAKLATMMKIKEESGVIIYYEAYTGEVAFENTETGDILFTNPYDVSGPYFSESEATKKQLLSQIHLTYLDNGEEKEMWSYEEAAERQQITMVDIKNGIRVEYKIGEPAIQRLTPRMISVERYEKFISGPIQEIIAQMEDGTYNNGDFDYDEYDEITFAWSKFQAFYEEKNTDAPGLTERAIKEMETAFPIVKQFPVVICETEISARELEILETTVKKYCPKYTYEELDFDNQQCGFKNTDQVPPRFAMALEYTISENGVIDVTLPANGISFDETLYQLQEVSILPFMGSGSNEYEGYTFLPDGSGTIFRYEDLKDTIYTVSGQVYGADYAYHEITGQNAQTLRFPVFGAVTNYTTPADGSEPEHDYSDSGFLAIITEGDSLATLTSDHGGALHPYNSVYATFTPRPSDTYQLMSGGTESGASFTVTSSRRFTGSYRMKYIMLSDKSEYEPTYFGMAEAYRDYLSDAGILEKKTETKETIPLYIESFGSMKGMKRVLSFPVSVDIPLTTFDDIQTMTGELAEMGITNVGYKLTGFANGGLDSTAPYKLKWQSVLGGSDGLEALVSFANEKGIELYPEFDFAYINARDTFDGVNLKEHAVKTIDGRYIRKQVYDSGYQDFVSIGGAAISASVFDEYWEAFSDRYLDYGIGGISLSTLGSDLNSDFDEDDPHHREDTKEYTAEMLASTKEENSIMLSGGNAYTLKYADIITDVALTSSEYIHSSQTVPFTGIVLHGSVDFTGTPINMEGDIDRAILNAIENGASMFFTLSYRNTQELASDEFWSKYYSVSYNIWKDDVKKYYDILNDALKELQDSYITDHRFIDAVRVPDEDEAAADEVLMNEYIEEIIKVTVEAYNRYRLAVLRAERLGTETPKKSLYRAELPAAPENTKEMSNFANAVSTAAENAYIASGSGELPTVDEVLELIQASDTTVTVPKLTLQYETQIGSVVYVEYGESTGFILNYNNFPVSVQISDSETVNIEANGFATVTANS